TRVVAQDAQCETVRCEPPHCIVVSVEELLGESERAAPSAAFSEHRGERVESTAGGSDNDREASADGAESDRGGTAIDLDTGPHHQRSEAEALPEQTQEKAVRERSSLRVIRQAGRELVPMSLSDAPITTDLIAKVQALRNSVIRFCLASRLKLGH